MARTSWARLAFSNSTSWGSLVRAQYRPSEKARKCGLFVCSLDIKISRSACFSPVCNGFPPKCEDDANVTFLPDGQHVAFTRSSGKDKHFKDGSDQIQHSDVVVSDLNGGNRRVILSSGQYKADYNFAYFSPDGKRFVYEHANSPLSKPANTSALFVANSDGSGDHRITPWSICRRQSRLVTGRELDRLPHPRRQRQELQHRHHPPRRNRPQAAGQLRAASNMRSATFSPDGKWIVFATNGGKGDANPAIYTMQTDGSHLQRITHPKLWDSAADWGSH